MNRSKSIAQEPKSAFTEYVKVVAELFKLRLTSLVLFSAAIGYILGSGLSLNILGIAMICLGGLLVTGASNTINQIIEKDIDKLMPRTQNRPLPTDRISVWSAIVLAGVSGVAGLLLITLFFNPLAGLLSAISLLSYGFIYTPLKRISSFAVFVGAIPGALPPIIGYVAATGNIDRLAVLLFIVQFIWQFPHFWAIAWLKFEDYAKAGIMLLPGAGRDRFSAMMSVLFVLLLIPAAIMLLNFGYIGTIGAGVLLLCTLVFLVPAIKLYQSLNEKDAKQLMFASFIYLPVSLIVILF